VDTVAKKKREWSFDDAVKDSRKALADHWSLESQRRVLAEYWTRPGSGTPQNIAADVLGTIGGVRHLEAVVYSIDDPHRAWPCLHLEWRYEAFRWGVYLERAEQLVREMPERAQKRRLPIGMIDPQYYNALLRIIAFSAVVGEDEVARWFGERCMQMMQNPPPYVRDDAWRAGAVEKYLMRLFLFWRKSDISLAQYGLADAGRYESVFTHWTEPTALEKSALELCRIHTHKILNRDQPDDDFIFGLQDGFIAVFPIEILFLRRVRRDLGLSIPDPEHPLLRTPLMQMPFPCPKSEPDEFIQDAYRKCREQMPDLRIPWETY
jgi:hypothetical protein